MGEGQIVEICIEMGIKLSDIRHGCELCSVRLGVGRIESSRRCPEGSCNMASQVQRFSLKEWFPSIGLHYDEIISPHLKWICNGL
jgi:hypothetical protein